MAVLTANEKRAFLRSILRQAVSENKTLLVALNAFQDACFQNVKTGSLVVEASGPSYSSKLQVMTKGMSPTEVLNLSEELFATRSQALTVLTALGMTEPTDTQVFEAMLADDSMQRVTATYGDYSMLRR